MESKALTPSISGIPLGNLQQATLFVMPEIKKPTREEVNKRVNTIKAANLERRNETIKSRFDVLYNEERLRYDDVIKKLAEEFSLANSTIESVLKG